ncbi:hypothetical protein HDU93_003840 [Gonapodya sp. JEL0774]|nr:hypothetical protein HDU93_003840 [Gonapodya sp. JEL0774]
MSRYGTNTNYGKALVGNVGTGTGGAVPVVKGERERRGKSKPQREEKVGEERVDGTDGAGVKVGVVESVATATATVDAPHLDGQSPTPPFALGTDGEQSLPPQTSSSNAESNEVTLHRVQVGTDVLTYVVPETATDLSEAQSNAREGGHIAEGSPGSRMNDTQPDTSSQATFLLAPELAPRHNEGMKHDLVVLADTVECDEVPRMDHDVVEILVVKEEETARNCDGEGMDADAVTTSVAGEQTVVTSDQGTDHGHSGTKFHLKHATGVRRRLKNVKKRLFYRMADIFQGRSNMSCGKKESSMGKPNNKEKVVRATDENGGKKSVVGRIVGCLKKLFCRK